jgi:hypothetical protein
MGRERGSRWTMPADIQIGTVHCGDDPSGWRFVIRSSAFETVAKSATAMVMRPTKMVTMLRARLTVTVSISVMAPAVCVADCPVREEGVAIAGTYASDMKT